MQTINLDLTPGGVPPVAHVSQFDVGREIEFDLYDNGDVYTIPSGATVYIDGTKSDNHAFSYSSIDEGGLVSFAGNVVTVLTTEQMTAAAGDARCEIKIKSGDTTLHTVNFVLDVEQTAFPSDSDLSDTDIPMIKKAADAGDKIDTLSDKIDKAEELIKQVEDNVASAQNSATAAATSEANAKASETNAQTAASSAQASATSAQTSATNAAASATNAKTSETNAKASETASATSEANAKTSEANASASETNAKTSETNAKASETAAAESQSAAKNSQTQAAGSATKAANQAKAAETSAANAATSETNAQTSATEAAQSASEAKASAADNEKWAKYSESYAKGGTDTRTGEDADNSKYYSDLSKQYAAQAQAAVTGVSFTIVDSLPSTGADGVFYLIAHDHGSGDSYDEYVWLKDQKKFERIGTTDVDLTDYVKRSDTATTAQNGTMSAADKTKLDSIESGATKTAVDTALDSTSENPVANKAVQNAFEAVGDACDALQTANKTLAANLQNLQNLHKSKTVTVLADGWTTEKNSDGYYTYTISGLTIYADMPEILLKDGVKNWSEEATYLNIYYAETVENSIVMYTSRTRSRISDFTIVIIGVE